MFLCQSWLWTGASLGSGSSSPVPVLGLVRVLFGVVTGQVPVLVPVLVSDAAGDLESLSLRLQNLDGLNLGPKFISLCSERTKPLAEATE